MNLTDRLLGPRDEAPLDRTELLRNEDGLRTGTETVDSGAVRVRRTVVVEPHEELVSRGVECADVERHPALEGDSGRVEHLPDGSISVPVFEEQLVVQRRLVVRERIVVRKRTVHEEHLVAADLRREDVRVDVDEDLERPGRATVPS